MCTVMTTWSRKMLCVMVVVYMVRNITLILVCRHNYGSVMRHGMQNGNGTWWNYCQACECLSVLKFSPWLRHNSKQVIECPNYLWQSGSISWECLIPKLWVPLKVFIISFTLLWKLFSQLPLTLLCSCKGANCLPELSHIWTELLRYSSWCLDPNTGFFFINAPPPTYLSRNYMHYIV